MCLPYVRRQLQKEQEIRDDDRARQVRVSVAPTDASASGSFITPILSVCLLGIDEADVVRAIGPLDRLRHASVQRVCCLNDDVTFG